MAYSGHKKEGILAHKSKHQKTKCLIVAEILPCNRQTNISSKSLCKKSHLRERKHIASRQAYLIKEWEMNLIASR